ncbi:hypothetical protein [Kribbella sp.]|uniref:hypothetical protein n=1 Tax=Kribbella sp. TaxID=1871183 RepID=UPI002D79FDB6|nr:hypothetical protein [Kribbella sp.]
MDLRFVGGNHAPDSVVAVVPDSGVMLLGERHAWYVDAHSAPRRLAAASQEAAGESPATET